MVPYSDSTLETGGGSTSQQVEESVGKFTVLSLNNCKAEGLQSLVLNIGVFCTMQLFSWTWQNSPEMLQTERSAVNWNWPLGFSYLTLHGREGGSRMGSINLENPAVGFCCLQVDFLIWVTQRIHWTPWRSQCSYCHTVFEMRADH